MSPKEHNVSIGVGQSDLMISAVQNVVQVFL